MATAGKGSPIVQICVFGTAGVEERPRRFLPFRAIAVEVENSRSQRAHVPRAVQSPRRRAGVRNLLPLRLG